MKGVYAMPYSTSDARKEFDRWSLRYDRDLLQHVFFGPSHRMLLGSLGAADGRVLDVGCGTGIFARLVREQFPDSRVWGLDLSEGMLRQCHERSEQLGVEADVVQGDSERLPFADDSFDVVTCAHSFHHYPRQDRVVAEMHRVLRPGGRLLILDGDRDGLWGRLVFDVVVVLMEGPVRHLTGRAFQDLYHDCGFAEVRQERRGGPLPFLMTVGRAVKQGRSSTTYRAA